LDQITTTLVAAVQVDRSADTIRRLPYNKLMHYVLTTSLP